MYNNSYPAFNPYTQPRWPVQPAQQAQPLELIRVSGIDGARAYQMPANSTVPLFDGGADILYIKSTDGAGFPTIRQFAFSPIEQQAAPAADYVTRK